jgi:branched-chain amino acid transport system ATP-binding protein
MIAVTNLTVQYGAVTALRDATIETATGAITAVLGANGAGKTTLLRTISGLVRPQAGTMTFNQHNLVGMKADAIARLGIAHVPEGRGVIAEFTVEENLRLGALAAKVPVADGLQAQYDQFPILRERRKQYASQLSGGERQMLALARAMITKPTVLLLDEPSLGLAPMVTADIMTTIRRLCADGSLTVILVEQNAKSALRIADFATVLHVGRTVATRPAVEVANDDTLRALYLGATHS